ncbi:molecular chaperone GrpE [Methanohalophilus levihalophilus]|uniref:nucleotide exchange factor GrpE n=1 Tax=Methanohalophilus levihalophilus TaxID=1431282 RepID=UPI001AE2C68A|nr:nucleotide exchange factor GrpE [Methanohalophilus levihalophilus]MBP2030959.1 molecular chaperone GrpE [Methanohalophilus levihalophilus]
MAGKSKGKKQTSDSKKSSDSSVKDELEDTKALLEEKDAEVLELKEQVLRQKAEFDNFRKRSRKEMEDFRKFAVENIMFDLLEVCDNFERALFSFRDAEDVKSVVNGVEMVYKQLISILEKEGLKRIECEGKDFDPHLHEATHHVESDQHPDNMVVEVCRTGYEFNSKVIRPAMVTVVRNPSEQDKS